MKVHFALTLAALSIVVQAGSARAECTEAGACASNEYCATAADGGTIVTDGGAGVCLPEPCVVSSDCPNDELCDTSQNPFKCVECISTADCPGDQLCDIATRTCVEPPDAGPPDAGSDAGEDGGIAVDASVDATVPTPPADGSVAPSEDGGDAAPPASVDAGLVDDGTLNGGACDCATVAPAHMAWGAAGSPVLLALSLLARRRAKKRARR